MEVGTLVRVPDAPQAAPDQAGGYQIPVSIRGGTYWALVDSGCNQTSIHQSLIQPEALDKSCMVRVRCVHGDVVKYPVVLLTIQFRGQKHKVEVAVNPRLRHPLILGTNWPAFKILLGVLCVDASCGKEKPEGEAAVRTGEAEPGPAEAAPGDYATRYPEAVALRNISAKSVAEALFSMISRVGIPKEILTDQGTAFMSRTIRELYELLGIKSIRTSVYHPQTDGLVERFNRTLKTMIRKFVHEDAKNWDKWLEPLLFAVREVPQASTGFSPFELLYGRQPRGVLDVLRETWEEGPSESKNEIQHVLDLRTKLHTLGQLSMENLLQAQDKQSRLYNRGARLRNFTPGDKVLVLLPTSSSKLLAKWQGPVEVTRQVGDLNYEVVRTDRSGARQIYHLNLLKKWNEVEPVMLATVVGNEEDLGPEASLKVPSLTLAPGGGSPLTLPAHRCSPVAERICGRVLAPARSNQPYSTPYWDRAGRGSAQPAVSFTGAQEKGGPVRIRGDARDGSNRRVPQWLGKPDRFGTENRRLGPILRGLSQGECGVEIRRLSNAAGWRVAWSTGYRSLLFDAGLN